MAEFLAYRIKDGKLSYSNVPTSLKKAVKAVLVLLGHEDLAKG